MPVPVAAIRGKAGPRGGTSSTLLTTITEYWKLDESSNGSGAVARVGSVAAISLTDNNTTASAAGIRSNGADFEVGNTEYLSVADSATLSMGDIGATFAVWFVPESVAGEMGLLVKWRGTGNNREYAIEYSAFYSAFLFQVSGDGTATTYVLASDVGVPVAGRRYLIVGWHDPTANKIYIQVNHGQVYEAAHTTGIYNGAADFTIGGFATGLVTADGVIDEVGIWKKVLTAAERAELWNGSWGTTYPFEVFRGPRPTVSAGPTTLWSTSGSDDWLGRPRLIELANGTWVAIYRSNTQHSNDANGKLHIRFSTDEGANWTAEDTKVGGGAVSGFPITAVSSREPSDAFMCLAPNGDLILAALLQTSTAGGGSKIYRSTDNGNTWSAEGLIDSDTTLAIAELLTVDNTIFAACWKDAGSDRVTPYQGVLYKSTDNGATWVYVSDVTSTAENTDEWSLYNTALNTFVAILRDTATAKTYQRVSTDNGATWGTLTDVTAMFGLFQRPRLLLLNGYLCCVGRSRFASGNYTAIAISPDLGTTWYLWNIAASSVADCGYADVLRRDSGAFYLLTYEGTTTAAAVVSYVFTIG